MMPSILCFDTETSGLADFKAPPGASHQPFCLELGWYYSPTGQRDDIMPGGFLIDQGPIAAEPKALETNGLRPADWQRHGVSPSLAVSTFGQLVLRADLLVGHNVEFDVLIMLIAAAKLGKEEALRGALKDKPRFCTKEHSTSICRIPNDKSWGGPYKWPKLAEAYEFFFKMPPVAAHRALKDVRTTWDLYWAIQSWIINGPGTEPPLQPALAGAP